MLGLDYSAGRPSGVAILAAGYGFVVRYLNNGLSGRVNLTAAEAADLNAAGVALALVWEKKRLGEPDRATQGQAAGVADAQAADAAAVACGLAGWPIYMAVDFDTPDYAPGSADPRAKLGPVGDYLAGAASVLGHGRTGVYGGFYAVSRALDAGLVAYSWQTAAWSGGQVDKRIHLFQRIGTVKVGDVDCDVDEARQAEYGQNPTGDDMLDPNDPIVQQLVAGASSVQFGKEGVRAAGDLALAVDNLRAELNAVKAAQTTPPAIEVDYDVLAAKVAAHIHLSGSVVAAGDQPPATT